MASWRIVIEGEGPVGEAETRGNAEAMGDAFVRSLRDSGHVVAEARLERVIDLSGKPVEPAAASASSSPAAAPAGEDIPPAT